MEKDRRRIDQYPIQRHITTLATAKEVWDKLREINEADQNDRNLILRYKLSSTKWRKDDTIQNYFHCTNALVEELKFDGDGISEAEISYLVYRHP